MIGKDLSLSASRVDIDAAADFLAQTGGQYKEFLATDGLVVHEHVQEDGSVARMVEVTKTGYYNFPIFNSENNEVMFNMLPHDSPMRIGRPAPKGAKAGH